MPQRAHVLGGSADAVGAVGDGAGGGISGVGSGGGAFAAAAPPAPAAPVMAAEETDTDTDEGGNQVLDIGSRAPVSDVESEPI